jgi:hypothetical protein
VLSVTEVLLSALAFSPGIDYPLVLYHPANHHGQGPRPYFFLFSLFSPSIQGLIRKLSLIFNLIICNPYANPLKAAIKHRMAIYLKMKDVAFLKMNIIVEREEKISTLLSVLYSPTTIFFLKFADDCGRINLRWAYHKIY